MHQVVGSSAQTIVEAPKPQNRRELLLAFAAGASILLASLTNFLLHNDYPLLRPEVAIVVGVLLLLAAVMALLYVGQRQWGRSLLDGLLVMFFADLNGVALTTALVAGLVVGLFTYRRKISFSGPLAFFGAVVLATKLAGIGGREAWLHTETHSVAGPQAAATPKFAILHLLLDEQAGVQGIYPDAEGLRLRQELKDFFEARGFTHYGRAYSEHMHTVNALPAVLNFGNRLASSATERGVTVGRNQYFERLAGQGFKVHVLQNDFADICGDNPVTVCTTYDSSSLRPTLTAPLSTAERAQLIGLKFAALSKVIGRISKTLNRAGKLGRAQGGGWSAFEPGNTSRTSTVAALAAVDEWAPGLKRARPGDGYFAHLLLPHYPHALRADCSYLPWSDWELRRSDTPIEPRRRSYAAQDRCTLLKLDEMIRAFEQSPGGRNGAIIIHGDHGARIMKTPPVTDLEGRFTDEDVIASHSTLFAVRSPETRRRYDETPQAITALLRGFAASGFKQDPNPAVSPTYTYVIADKHWKPQRKAALPGNW